MSMELPVVSTIVGAEGIDASEEQGLYLVNNEIEFADKIFYLMKHPELAIESGNKARDFIIKNHTWEDNVKIMIDNYKKLLIK